MDDDLEIGARNLMLCRRVTFDAAHIAAPYTLHNLLSRVRIGDGGFQKKSTPICAYVEYFGNPREYEVWIDVVLLGYDETSKEVEEAVVTYGPFDLNLPSDAFVVGRYYYLRNVPLLCGGTYEFHLKIAGVFEPLISQRLYVED